MCLLKRFLGEAAVVSCVVFWWGEAGGGDVGKDVDVGEWSLLEDEVPPLKR